MAEFKAGEHSYRSRKLTTFEQLFIVKRLAGALKAAMNKELLTSIFAAPEGKEGETTAANYLGAFTEAIGKMPEDDFIYIINTCFRATSRSQGTMWMPLIGPGDTHMFQDISAAQTLQIVYDVLSENLTSFFGELLSILGLGETAPPQK